jgi:hypothetical protein
VTGTDTPQHRIENKHCRRALLATQIPRTQWALLAMQIPRTQRTMNQGKFDLPSPLTPLASHRVEMCPSGLALHHPAAELLKEWAKYGCPNCTGKPWTRAEMQEVVD